MPDQGAFSSNDAPSCRACDETHAIGAERRTDALAAQGCDEMHTGDRAIADLARRQRGVVTTAQLAAAGIGRRSVAHRVAHGRLTRVLRGLYRVGPIPPPSPAEMAALPAPDGALSFPSSAAVGGVRPPY